jgi:hypothetical protein
MLAQTGLVKNYHPLFNEAVILANKGSGEDRSV